MKWMKFPEGSVTVFGARRVLGGWFSQLATAPNTIDATARW